MVLDQAVLQWVKRRQAKLGMMYSKTPVDRREAIPWASLTQMSLLSTSRRISNRLLVPLAALPRELSHGTTWRHITFLMGRELCSTREGGGFYCPNQWILLKFVLWQFPEMKKNQWDRWRAHVWRVMFQCQGLSFQSSLPECAGSAICRELKAKTALAEEPVDSRNTLFLFLLASFSAGDTTHWCSLYRYFRQTTLSGHLLRDGGITGTNHRWILKVTS